MTGDCTTAGSAKAPASVSLTCATGDSALAPGPVMPGELRWLDVMVAVHVDSILVVHPRIALLEQQLGWAQEGLSAWGFLSICPGPAPAVTSQLPL